MAPRWGHGADWDNAERVIHRPGWGRRRPDPCRRCVGVPTRILDRDLEAEAQRPVRLQVVAGPRFEPATDSHNGVSPRADLWITAPRVRTLGSLPSLTQPLVVAGCGGPQSPKSTRLTFEMDIV